MPGLKITLDDIETACRCSDPMKRIDIPVHNVLAIINRLAAAEKVCSSARTVLREELDGGNPERVHQMELDYALTSWEDEVESQERDHEPT